MEKAATAPKLKAEVLMRDLSKAERRAILSTTGNADDTWWNWCRHPRKVPAGAFMVILDHLEKKHGRPITIQEAFQPYV